MSTIVLFLIRFFLLNFFVILKLLIMSSYVRWFGPPYIWSLGMSDNDFSLHLLMKNLEGINIIYFGSFLVWLLGCSMNG